MCHIVVPSHCQPWMQVNCTRPFVISGERQTERGKWEGMPAPKGSLSPFRFLCSREIWWFQCTVVVPVRPLSPPLLTCSNCAVTQRHILDRNSPPHSWNPSWQIIITTLEGAPGLHRASEFTCHIWSRELGNNNWFFLRVSSTQVN